MDLTLITSLLSFSFFQDSLLISRILLFSYCQYTVPSTITSDDRIRDSSTTIIMTSNDDKTRWPELVGKAATEAKAIIERDSGNKLHVHIVPEGSPVTMDYRLDRVRIFENAAHKVVSPPTTG